MNVVDTVGAVSIVLGVMLAIVAGIGLHRFPDVFARMHAASKPATLGTVLILAGAALRSDTGAPAVLLLLAIGLQFITVPIGAHMVGRATYRAGTELSPQTVCDELAERERASASDDEDPRSRA